MELTLARLQKLIGGKAPIVGIPRPTEKPFAVERVRLAGLIEGLEGCEISLNSHLEIHAPARHYKLNGLDMRRWTDSYKTLRAWATRQRAKKGGTKTLGDSPAKVGIAEKNRYCRARNPPTCCLPTL